MKSIETTLFHRVLLPEHPTTTHHPTLIMLHGRGADEEDLLGLAQYLDERFLIISPRAPNVFSSGGSMSTVITSGCPSLLQSATKRAMHVPAGA